MRQVTGAPPWGLKSWRLLHRKDNGLFFTNTELHIMGVRREWRGEGGGERGEGKLEKWEGTKRGKGRVEEGRREKGEVLT